MTRPLPRLALVVIVGAACLNLPALSPFASLPVNTALLVLGLGVVVWELLHGRLDLSLPLVVLLAAAAVFLMLPGTLGGLDPLNSWLVLEVYLKDVLFLVTVVLLASAVGDSAVRVVAMVVTLCLALLGGLAVLDQLVFGNSLDLGGLVSISTSGGVGVDALRQQGPFSDPNFFGRLVVLALPLDAALLSRAWSRGAKAEVVVWAGAGVGVLGGVYLSGSRGAMLASLVAVVVWMWWAGPTFRRRLVVIPFLVLPLLAVPGVGSRLLTLDNITSSSSSFAEEDGSVLERAAAARVTTKIFEAHPVVGVGPGNLDTTAEPYAAAGRGVIYRNVAAHNTYLQLAAEDGVIGLLGWLVFLGGLVVVAGRTARAYAAAPEPPPGDAGSLAAAAAGAAAAWAVASIFLHLAYLRPFYAVVALVAVLARSAPALVRAEPALRGPLVARRSRLVLAAVVLVVVVGGGVWGYPHLRAERWRADVEVALEPAGGSTDAYRLSLISRRRVVATYATVVLRQGQAFVGDRGVVTVASTGQSTGTSLQPTIRVQVLARTRSEATRLALGAAEASRDLVARTTLLNRFAVATVGSVVTTPTQVWSLTKGAAG
ncbi:hypothetical protein GCM10027596_22510 [Nocardioides korecus]